MLHKPLESVSGSLYVRVMRSNTRSEPARDMRNIRDTSYELSVDAAEQTLITAEQHIARLKSIQMEALEVIDTAQVATGDGARTLAEWVAARTDVSLGTAKSLVRTMRRTADRPELREACSEASVSFDRVEAVSRIMPSGDPDVFFHHFDIATVQREAARRIRITADKEARTSDDQYLILQPSLDESWWKVWGGLDGAIGAVVDEAIARAADQLPTDDPNMPRDTSWRRAIGLAMICVSEHPLPTQVSVFVDADQAVGTAGGAGVYLEAGPRVGRKALEGLFCDSTSELFLISEQAEPLRYGRKSRTIPPSLRRAIIHRDRNRCAIDGCDSRNRLQIHHITPWSQGGPTDPSNLLTLCWYHHQVAVHQHDLEPYRHPGHGRWRLRPAIRPPPEP